MFGLLGVLMVLTADRPAAAQTESSHVYFKQFQLKAAEVVAVSIRSGFAAFKVTGITVGAEGEGSKGFDCHYAGMEKYPGSAMKLVLWSLTEQRAVTETEVYEGAAKAAECTPPEESKKRLAAANADFASHGLDVSKKPVSTKGPMVLKVVGKKPEPDDEEVNQRFEYWVGKTKVYENVLQYAQGGPAMKVLELVPYVQGDRAVIFERQRTEDLRELEERFGFSAVLSLAKPSPVTLKQFQTRAAEVLAVSIRTGFAAFKVTGEFIGDEAGGSKRFDCQYPGLEKLPGSAVRLVLWSLTAQKAVAVTEVYEGAAKAAECTPPAKSKKRLDAAMADFAARGLDLSKSPLAGTGPMIVKVLGSKELGPEDDEVFETHRYLVGKTKVYETRSSYDSGGKNELEATAFVQDGRVVFFENRTISDMRQLDAQFGFSPILSLPAK